MTIQKFTALLLSLSVCGGPPPDPHPSGRYDFELSHRPAGTMALVVSAAGAVSGSYTRTDLAFVDSGALRGTYDLVTHDMAVTLDDGNGIAARFTYDAVPQWSGVMTGPPDIPQFTATRTP